MQTRPEAEPAPRGSRWIVLAAVLLATAAVYARSLAGELVYDDRLLIVRNPLITDLANLPRLFGQGYWDFLDAQQARTIGYWRPLSAVVQALVWPFAGGRPLPYHLVSVALHLLATGAAFALVRRLGASLWLAGFCALLFGLHPAHVESVAWISAMNDPLSAGLVLLGLERFLAWRARGSRGVPVAAACCFLLGLLAKEMAIAFVPLVLALDVLWPWPAEAVGARLGWRARLRAAWTAPLAPTRAYAPIAVALALYLGARMLVFASPWAGFERQTTDFVVGAGRLALLRVELLGGALDFLSLPLEPSLFRPFRPHLERLDPTLVRAFVFLGVGLAVSGAALVGGHRRALAALALVVLGFLPVLVRVESLGQFPLSDRFLYVPVLGLALGAALFLERTLTRRTAGILLGLVAAAYVVRSVTRIGDWHDEERLFRVSAAQAPRSVYAQWGLGRTLLESYARSGNAANLAQANQAFERAAALLEESRKDGERTDVMVTSYDVLQVNLGLAWCSIHARDWSAALAMLLPLAARIEEIQSRAEEARNRGLRVREQFLELERVYTALGVAHDGIGDHEEAEKAFRHAIEIEPNSPEAHYDYGHVLARQGRWQDAVREFEISARLRPGSFEDRLSLCESLQMMGQSERADPLARALLDERPGRTEPLIVLATGASRRGDTAQALTWLERALEIEPRNGQVWYQKACALLARGDRRAALLAFRNAVELDPTSFAAHHDLASFLLSEGAITEAQPFVVRAYLLSPPEHREALRRNLLQMELQPEEIEALLRADSERGAPEDALVWAERWLALQPNAQEAALQRARLLRRLHRDEECVEALRQAAARDGESFELWSELATTLAALQRPEEAAEAARHALALDRPPHMPAGLAEGIAKRMRELAEPAVSPGVAPDAEPR